ncbi:hypothetical protein [Prosthecobacter sp.]|uniref:hypothetical protein n=1 Tax=Prosthecobacter sp. TaxID=1965333 RepID=UPI002ABB8E0C|nr:hypothetical protein [Prosthecobacter sp.]MDZ4404423.1 hypothetical protein [Prosthecobacter sp.]
MSHDRFIVALLFVLVPGLVLNWNERPSSAFDGILARLRHECDPTNPEADYYWSQRSMPTERKREAIIQDCRRIGAALLPDVRRQMKQELDDEMRGMLIVIAAALGDADSVKKAGREMAWSDFHAVRISAAKTLRRLQDRQTIEWFFAAMDDGHFVVNGGCGTLREKFYPVRCIARLALWEVVARHPDDSVAQRWLGLLNEMEPFETFEDLSRRMAEAKKRELEARAEAEYRLLKGK